MALELIVSPILEVIFDKLTSLVSREFRLLRGLHKDLENLSKIFSTIRSVLEDAEVKQIRDKPTRDWLGNLKDAAYDAEDLLDEFEFEALQQESQICDMSCAKHVSDSLSACFDLKQIVFRHKMGKKIKELIETFNEIDEQRFKFQLIPGVVVTGVEEFGRERETSSMLTEPIVCGRGRETENIIGILLNNSSSSYDLSICPIVGIGGLGKTTLAKLVYNDEKVVNQFDNIIWICVSEDFSIKRVSNMIINQLSEKKWDIEDLEPTENQLKKLLNGRRYLLVLDDVWDDDREKWNKIMHLLACGGKGSSIIVTTRLQTVVTSIASLQSTISSGLCLTNPTINLEILLEHDSQTLFKHYAFGAGGEKNHNFTQIGVEIVRKCSGLPLAIKAMGSLLNSKSEAFWGIIRDSEIWDLEEYGETTILPALRLSYSHLPPSFRQCFSYCSVYPKDWTFQKDRLINEWMANGFIQYKGALEFEDIGDKIFNGLWQRSFFQNIVEDVTTGVVQFEMHDLVHDLACSVMKECSRKITKVEDSPQRVRHLSLTCDSPYLPNTLPTLFQPFLRTLVFFIVSQDLSKTDLLQSSFSRLKYLRMLDLAGIWNLKNLPPSIGHLKFLKYLDLDNTGIANLAEFVCGLTNLQVLLLGQNERLKALPSSVGKLKNLRYLDLSETSIKVLPESISTLTNLQTLKLGFCRKLERLPREMKSMKSLRHLIIEWEMSTELLIRGMPVGIGELTRLETLKVFVVSNDSEGSAGIEELGRLNKLKGILAIEGIRHVCDPRDAQQANLKNKHKISRLNLFWGSGEVDVETEEEEKKTSNQILEYLEPHPNIQKLMIEDYPGVELPGWLRNCALTLPNLRELQLTKMPNAVHVLHQLPPNLTSLWITACPKLRFHPELRYPSSITTLSVGVFNDPTLRSVQALPYLSKLQIDNFRGEETLSGSWLRNLTCLRELWIANCSHVKSLLPELENLAETLKELKISWCDDLDCVTEEGLLNLASLQTLLFQGCSGLTSLSDSPSSLRHLKSLTKLDLVDCPKLVLAAIDFQHLVALETLMLEELPQLTSLPDGIQHVTTLQGLSIRKCKNMRTLPEWLLQQHLPPSLYYLQIRGCHPEMHKSCEVDKGEDWHKISHLHVDNIE
ncbi:hypothetical protein ACHQM5_014751 [Ranunculus cassubicifolius]